MVAENYKIAKTTFQVVAILIFIYQMREALNKLMYSHTIFQKSTIPLGMQEIKLILKINTIFKFASKNNYLPKLI